MNGAVRDAKMAHKNQKKQQQKFNKKQQLVQQNQKYQQQLQHQQQQQQQNLMKDQNENVTIAPSLPQSSFTATALTAKVNNKKMTGTNVLNNSKMSSTNLCNSDNNSNNNNNYNNHNNKNEYHNNLINDNSNNNNNNNNNIAQVNVSQMLKEYYHQQKQQQQQQQQQQQLLSKTMPIIIQQAQQTTNMPKFERSSSFSLKGKLTKLINSITSSKENLHKQNDETQALPTQFTRSRSLILPRRTNRRSFIEPQLEQLTEEAEKSIDAMSPSITRRNSKDEDAKDEVTTATTITTTTTTTASTKTNVIENGGVELRSVSQPIDIPNTQNGECQISTPVIHRKMSTMKAIPSTDPQIQFKKRRSNTLIASFRNTITGLTGLHGGDKKKDKLNPKWSASLQSLQAIDNMISYENMSFIDYDKFNGYEKQLERELSQYSLMDPILNSSLQCIDSLQLNEQFNDNHIVDASTSSPVTPLNNCSILNTPFATPQTVVRRRSRQKMEASSTSRSSLMATAARHHDSNRKLNERPQLCHSVSRHSFNFDTDYEHNLDKPRNVYRDSLDSRKLELLNAISRSSYTLQDSDVIDVLDLAVATYSKHRKHFKRSHQRKRNGGQHNYIKRNAAHADTVDAAVAANKQLKSKSLTHLDGLQTEMICNHAKNTNNISSSEYFSVSFCTESGCQEEEFFAATKGVTLAIALSQTLRRRNLSLSKLIITDTNDNNRITNILETGSTTVYNALDENIDVECLAGHHLIVTDKEGSRKTLQKANSFSSRVRPPRLLSSASTDESCDPNLTGNKQVKQRWSGLFGVKNPQQAQLCELLNNYTKNGVPQTTITTYNFDHPEQEDALNYLDSIHKSWKDIVEYSRMTDAELRIQTAIWELVTTEVDYIHCLQTVTDLFLACLEAIQAEGLLQDIDQYRLFANIRDICEANLKFWTFYLYPMVSHSIISREHLHISFFQTGFVQFGQIFAPYKKYCAEQSSCQFYCKELNRTNSLFTSYLAWCESQKMCNRLRLADILVRPMQRLTKYSLLLAAIKKHLTNVEEIEAIDLMLHTTENFVFSVNNHLTTRQENERLKGVMARIESYDVVDTNNEQLDRLIKQNSQMFDLCGPMKGCAPHHVRHLFMEGDHKYKDNHGKIDVHCFLLTDMLLVCKSIAKKGLGSLKIIRQPYLTDRLVVQHSHNVLLCVYLNEFQVATTAFSLHCNEAKNWYDAVKRAKMIYTRLKQCSVTNWDNTNVRYGGGSIISGSTLDSLGIKKSPMNSSICSHVTSANNSHSGSMEWNDSRIVSADFEKTNSLSSDEGCSYLGVHGFPVKVKPLTTTSPQKLKVNPTSSANSLGVQPTHHLGQSLPNLTLHHSHTNNTLAVPASSGTTNHSGTILLSASHRGISYPPPSPTRVPLRRAMAFSSSIKNPPLLKTRNITSQSSINWHQIPATPTPTTTPQNTLLNQAIPNTITTNIETTTSTSISTTATTTIASTNATTCYALVPTAFYTQSNINSNTNTQSMLHSNTDMTLNGVISISLRSDAENASLTDSTDI